MAVDVFLKIEGIPGESADGSHKDEIDVMSYSWGVSQTGTASYGGGMGAGKANFNDFHFMMRMNKATPKLMTSVATGEHIKGAVLSCRKAGGKQQDYRPRLPAKSRWKAAALTSPRWRCCTRFRTRRALCPTAPSSSTTSRLTKYFRELSHS